MESVKLSQRAIAALQKIISGGAQGSESPSPYLSGPDLINFFNEFGYNDRYGAGFGSRGGYTETRLSELNGTESMVDVIEAAVDPLRFKEGSRDVVPAVEFLNPYLQRDGYELLLDGDRYRLRKRGEPLVALKAALRPTERASHEFIEEQAAKCDKKLQGGDYDGAITNARSLVEAVLTDVEDRLDAGHPAYDGDLPKLYKRVQKLLNLDPARQDVSDSLRQVLSGLTNIINGLAPLRNKMSDAHVRTSKPARHHAKLAVNAAKTVSDFVLDSFEAQQAAGKIKPIGGAKPPDDPW